MNVTAADGLELEAQTSDCWWGSFLAAFYLPPRLVISVHRCMQTGCVHRNVAVGIQVQV